MKCDLLHTLKLVSFILLFTIVLDRVWSRKSHQPRNLNPSILHGCSQIDPYLKHQTKPQIQTHNHTKPKGHKPVDYACVLYTKLCAACIHICGSQLTVIKMWYYSLNSWEGKGREDCLLICLHELFQEQAILHIKRTYYFLPHAKRCSPQEQPFKPLLRTGIRLLFIAFLEKCFDTSLQASSTSDANLIGLAIFYCY